MLTPSANVYVRLDISLFAATVSRRRVHCILVVGGTDVASASPFVQEPKGKVPGTYPVALPFCVSATQSVFFQLLSGFCILLFRKRVTGNQPQCILKASPESRRLRSQFDRIA